MGHSSALPRLLRAAIPAILLLGLIAAPVSAARPVPTASATTAERTCGFVVSYSWARFAGKGLIATVGLYERVGSVDTALSVQGFEGEVGRTGSVSLLVNLTVDAVPDGRILVVRGSLTDARTSLPVAGSAAESATVVSTCG